VKTEGKRVCEVCGTVLSENSESCPVCALRAAISPETEALPDIPSELQFDQYRILKDADGASIELGHGAMGVTYKAFDVHLQCPVALKIINARYIGDASARHRFVREARAAASVRHPNVASVFHLGESGGNYFYAMEFVDGETLEKLIRKSGRLETDLALEVVTHVAAGLTGIEKQHLVHRDIKPSNIMVSWEQGRLESVKIIDLGLAKGVVEQDTISVPGGFVGTPAYASPEQFAGVATDIRSDLYSLGVTLWEMVSGDLPFRGSAAELMYEHQHAAPPTGKLRNVPAPIIALLQVLLEKDPSQRFQEPAQLREALAKVKKAIASNSLLTPKELRGGGDQMTELSPKLPPRKRAFRWLVAAFCLAGLLLGAFLFYAYRESFSNQRSAETVVTEKSIAVLPFESLSDNKNDSYFADGVQDEILNNLAKIAQLKVICRTSVMQYRTDTKPDLRQIAIALGVANVLEGTVRREGNRVRVSTELVDAHNANTIWADSYDRDLTNIFAIQSEIAQTVAARLSAKLSPEEQKDITEEPTKNLEAYDLYLRARQLLVPNSVVALLNVDKETFAKAIGLLKEATQKDNKFALAYCLAAKAHDYLYTNRIDHTPERRALGDAAVNEALRLRPELGEVHLAAAYHLFLSYNDIERARVQIAIAAQTLPNNPGLLQLSALIDRVQGKWEKSTANLEKAATLDPRNPDLLTDLAFNYWCLRRYGDNERILDRLIELEPDQPLFPLNKAQSAFSEKADLKGLRAAYEALPASMKDDPEITWQRICYAMFARDFAAAREIVSKSPNEEIYFAGALVPKQVVALILEFVRGNHPTMEEFGAAREQLYRKVEADRSNPFLMTALACADLALGRNEESIQEGKRAMEMLPISEDAIDGPIIAAYVAAIYAWTNHFDAAFEQLNILIKLPSYRINYGDLKTDFCWDPLRKDPRFDKLLTELAPRD
jgi:serine/threonine protein kinase